MSNQIQLFTSRDQECERMNVVFIYTSTQFKLKPDTFVISKSKSSWGGAFSTTKLQWKTENAALKTEDLKFVSEYFLTLGMSQIQQSRSIANYAGNKNCGDYKAPPKQINPFADEDEDDLGGGSFSVSGGVSGQSGGNNYNAKFGYKNEWDEDDLGTSVRRFDPRRKPSTIVWDEDNRRLSIGEGFQQLVGAVQSTLAAQPHRLHYSSYVTEGVAVPALLKKEFGKLAAAIPGKKSFVKEYKRMKDQFHLFDSMETHRLFETDRGKYFAVVARIQRLECGKFAIRAVAAKSRDKEGLKKYVTYAVTAPNTIEMLACKQRRRMRWKGFDLTPAINWINERSRRDEDDDALGPVNKWQQHLKNIYQFY